MPGTSHPGLITINTGTWTDTCTTEYDLIANQAKRPVVRDIMEYANRRSMTTLLTSDIVGPYGIRNDFKTKIPEVSTKGTAIGNNAYEFPVMGRLTKASVILSQIGSTQTDGRFQLKMQDRYLYDGQNVAFYGGFFQARVEGNPTGSPASGWIYSFWAPSGDSFVWATHVAGQAGTKTCYPLYTSYGERSEKSDSRSKFPDKFKQYTTIQRKTTAITGTALSQILWFIFTNPEGGETKGWMYEQLRQAQATFMMENEYQKWFGVTSMKNSDGTDRATPPLDNRGEPIVQGDGVYEQLAGGNAMEGSGSNGESTIDDIKLMMKQLETKSDKTQGCHWVIISGTDGYANLQDQAVSLGINQNITNMNIVSQNGQPGGAVVDVGYTFSSMNIAGNQVTFCKHPMFDDELAFPEKGADQRTLMSSMMFVIDVGVGSAKNMEVLYKAANGADRSNVTATMNGMTGSSEMVISEEDSKKYAMLKEDMICIYNTMKCGIIRKVR